MNENVSDFSVFNICKNCKKSKWLDFIKLSSKSIIRF